MCVSAESFQVIQPFISGFPKRYEGPGLAQPFFFSGFGGLGLALGAKDISGDI